MKNIQDMGGHVIRLLRAPFPEDEHESETALDFAERDTIDNYKPCDGHRIRFDAIIDNRKMTIPEQNEAVWKLVTERNWI